MARRIQKTRAKPPLTYKAAGVNIDAGQELVERIKGAVARTRRVEVLGDLGGFGGLFKVPGDRYKRPILVAGTDGVGTKIELAGQYDAHECIGIDLVAMCVNDVIVVGAEPLFFLDPGPRRGWNVGYRCARRQRNRQRPANWREPP